MAVCPAQAAGLLVHNGLLLTLARTKRPETSGARYLAGGAGDTDGFVHPVADVGYNSMEASRGSGFGPIARGETSRSQDE
jgi:hypothetical protein